MLAVKEKFKCNMKIIRPFENGNFTQVNNNIVNDTRLDLKEKGLMLHILSKPDGWFLNVDEIAKSNRDGKKSIYSGIKKLKELGYISLVNHYENGKIAKWEYIVNVNPSIDINNTSLLSQKVEVGFVQVENRHYNNTNSNNTNINNNDDNKTKKNHEQKDLSFEGNNVETSLISFADEVDKKEIGLKIENLANQNLDIKLSSIENLQRKSEIIRKRNPKNIILETIDKFPEFARMNKAHGDKTVYTDNQSFNYLSKILESDCQYPKWFNDSYKQEEVKKQVNNLEDSWKSITNIWKAQGNRIDDSIKIMITNIMEFIQDFEYHKKNNLVYDKKLMLNHFNTSIKQTLSKKSAIEMMDIIKEYTSKTWLSLDPFKKQIDSFSNDGLTLETIKSYFDSRGI